MRVTIIKDDGVVLVDKRAIKVGLSDLPANIHAVHFDGVKGHVEFNDGTPHAGLTDVTEFQTWIDQWEVLRAAEDAPPKEATPEEVASKEQEAIKAKLADIDLRSIRAIREYIVTQPDAPKVLKDREAEAVAERVKLK